MRPGSPPYPGTLPFWGKPKPLVSAASPWTPDDITEANAGFWYREQYIGDVTGWKDKIPVGGLGDATAINDPKVITPDADWLSSTSLNCLELSAHYFDCPGVSSDYKSLHDGTGATFGMAFKITDAEDASQYLFGTNSLSAAAKGIALFHNATAQTVRYTIADGTGAFLVDVTTGAVLAPNSSHSLVVCFKDNSPGVASSGTDDWSLWVDGTKVLSGELSASLPSTADPQAVGRIMARAVSATWFSEGNIAEAIFVKDELGSEMAAYLETQRL